MEMFLGIVAAIGVFVAAGLMSFVKIGDINETIGEIPRGILSIGIGLLSAIIIFCFIYYV